MLYTTLQWIERGNDEFAERRSIEHNSLSLALLLTESPKVSVVNNYYFVLRLILILI